MSHLILPSSAKPKPHLCWDLALFSAFLTPYQTRKDLPSLAECCRSVQVLLTTCVHNLCSQLLFTKRLQEMSSVTENNRNIPAIHKVGNPPVSVTDNILLYSPLITTFVHSFCSQLLFTNSSQNCVHKFCSQLLFTNFLHNFCLQLLFKTFVQNFCSKLLFTTFVYSFCSQLLFTIFVHNFCPQLLFTNFVHKLKCIKSRQVKSCWDRSS